MLRQTILKKIIACLPVNLGAFLLAEKKALTTGFFSKLFFFLKNSNYSKSYHRKTEILKFCPFFDKLLLSSPCYY